MKTSMRFLMTTVIVLTVSAFLQSCFFVGGYSEVSPRGNGVQDFNKINNFDGLDMGSAFNVSVKRANTFSIVARGDQSDLDDLEAYVNRNGTLVMQYRVWRVRRYRMDVDITMPDLKVANFSGAINATIDGFNNLKSIDINLSGATKTLCTGSADKLYFDLSGASELTVRGKAGLINGQLSGASKIDAYDFDTDDANLDLSGASLARVSVRKTLRVSASGASTVRFRGNPTDVRQNLTGGSTMRQE